MNSTYYNNRYPWKKCIVYYCFLTDKFNTIAAYFRSIFEFIVRDLDYP